MAIKRRFGPAALMGSILLMAPTGFLMVEILQRQCFKTRKSQVHAALAEFKGRCSLAIADPYEIILAAEGTRNPGRVEIYSDREDPSYRHRNHFWQLSAVFKDTEVGRDIATHRMLFIGLIQRRTLFLHWPELHVLGRPSVSLMKIFSDILLEHGLTYSETLPPD